MDNTCVWRSYLTAEIEIGVISIYASVHFLYYYFCPPNFKLTFSLVCRCDAFAQCWKQTYKVGKAGIHSNIPGKVDRGREMF